MDIENIYESITTTIDYDCFIKETSDIASFDPKIQKHLNYLYGSIGNQLRMAPIVNALFTQNLQTFMFSHSTLDKLYAQDSQVPFNSLSTHEYKAFFENFKESPLFEVLRESTNNRSGVYKLVKPEILQLLINNVGMKFLAGQEKYAVNYFDNFEQHKKSKKKEKVELDYSPESKAARKASLKAIMRSED